MNIEQPGPDTFLELADTPNSYSGQAGNDVNVKGTEDGLEFSSDGSVITGSGTTNTLPKFTASGTLGNSSITDDGTKVAGTLPLTLPAGAVGTPTLYFGTNTATGLYQPAANQIGVSMNGTQRLLFAANGDMTITGRNDSTGVIKITTTSSAILATTKAITINLGTPGILATPTGIEVTATDVGSQTPIAYSAIFSNNNGVGLAVSGGSAAYGISTSSVGTVVNGTSFSTGIALSASANNNRFMKYSNGNEMKFLMYGNGVFAMTGTILNPRAAFGRLENGLVDTEDLNAATWTKTGAGFTITPNSVNAPDGSINTADKFQAGAGTPELQQTSSLFATTAGKTFTFSVWMKHVVKGGAYVYISIDSGNETGTVYSDIDGQQSGVWILYSVTQTFTAGSTGSPKVRIKIPNGWTTAVWGASLTEATSIQGYVPNTGSATFSNDYGAAVNGTLYLGSNISTKQIIRAGESQSGNLLEIQNKAGTVLTAFDSTGLNLILDTTTGTKIGTATTQKLALWNAAPIVQPTTAVTAATFVANTSGIVNDSATFDGYTIGQVVKALRNLGALA